MVRSPRVLLGSFLSATLLGVNWFVYIWAVAHDRVVDGSLGYFITPLVSVSLGVLFFREALRAAQRLAIATAALGVGWLTLQFGQLPWVGLSLAFSFGSSAWSNAWEKCASPQMRTSVSPGTVASPDSSAGTAMRSGTIAHPASTKANARPQNAANRQKRPPNTRE